MSAPERLRRDDGDERRVDAAGKAEHDRLEAALGDVIADAEDEGAEELLFLVGGQREGRRAGPEAVAADIDDEQMSSAKLAPSASTFALRVERDAVAVEDQLVVRADHVDLHERHFLVARDALQHGEPRALPCRAPTARRRC